MPEGYYMVSLRIIIACISLVLIWSVVTLVRKRKLKVEYSILWLAMGAVIILLSLWPALINILVEALGIYYLTLIFLVSFTFVLLMLIHFSTIVSRLSENEMILAQKQAILEWKIKKLMEGARQE
jgi:hypothetical protein